MARRLHADRRGISPVVATVILVAVTIVVAVAVAYWMGGLTAMYTRVEKIEITSSPVTYAENMSQTFGLNVTIWNCSGWKITINMKNTGSADTTIDNVLINGKLWNDPSYQGRVDISKEDLKDGQVSVFVAAGSTGDIIIYIKKGGAPFTPGTSIEIRLHSSGGHEYPRQVTLP